jgi:hypothetical protein
LLRWSTPNRSVVIVLAFDVVTVPGLRGFFMPRDQHEVSATTAKRNDSDRAIARLLHRVENLRSNARAGMPRRRADFLLTGATPLRRASHCWKDSPAVHDVPHDAFARAGGAWKATAGELERGVGVEPTREEWCSSCLTRVPAMSSRSRTSAACRRSSRKSSSLRSCRMLQRRIVSFVSGFITRLREFC